MNKIIGWFIKGISFEEAPSSLVELRNSSTRTEIDIEDLLVAAKWEPLLQGKKQENLPGWVPLEQLASFRRGIATGANNFFLLSKPHTKLSKV